MTRVLVDTNVALDVLLERQPHFTASAAVWSAIEMGTAQGYLAAHGITAIHYLARRQLGIRRARRVIMALLQVFRVAPIDENTLREALDHEGNDFEDAVTAAAARLAECDAIVTRDPKGFRGTALPVLTPEAAALHLSEE